MCLIEKLGDLALENSLKKALRHVYWIGGPANAGKTTVASIIAWQKGFQRYSYDKNAMDHFERLSRADDHYREIEDDSLSESWSKIASGQVVRQTLKTFEDRFPLVLEDLLAIPNHTPIIAEGIGLTPALVHPLLSHPNQAIWLIPEPNFMEAALRQKVGGLQAHMMKEASKTIRALLHRDNQMVKVITEQAQVHHFKMITIDGLHPKTGIVQQVLAHFQGKT